MLQFRRLGHGPVLVLQHGFLSAGAYWSQQASALQNAFDVIMPDLPGFGGSPSDTSADTVVGICEKIIALLDHLGVSRFSFLGHSMGGMIAQQIALDHSARLDRLVLYGTSPVGEIPGRFETLERSIERLREEGIAAAAGRIVPTWFVDGTRSADYQSALRLALTTDAAAAERMLWAIAAWDTRPQSAMIGAQTLVICGDRDRSSPPEVALDLCGRIPNADLCIVPRCAHNVHLEKPELFTRVVRSFLTG